MDYNEMKDAAEKENMQSAQHEDGKYTRDVTTAIAASDGKYAAENMEVFARMNKQYVAAAKENSASVGQTAQQQAANEAKSQSKTSLSGGPA